MGNELTANMVVGYLIVSALQWAKRKHWIPVVDFDAARANRFVAAVLAFIASLGISATYDSEAGSLLITGLSLATLGPMAFEWVRQFVVQQIIYKTAFRDEPAKVDAPGAVDPRRFVGTALLVGAVGLGAAGCVGTRVTLPQPPQPTEQQVQAVREKAAQLADAVRESGELVEQVVEVTHQAWRAGLPVEQRDAVYQAAIDLRPKMEALVAISKDVTSEDALRNVTRTLLDVLDRLLSALERGNTAMSQSAAALRTALATLREFAGGDR